MDASKIQSRPDPLVTSVLSQRTKSLESNEPAIETRSDNDTDDRSAVSGGTVSLSDTSLKLSASSPVKSSDQVAPIESRAEAQQAASKLIVDIQNNPLLAQSANSNVFAGAVKSLLG